MRPERSDIIFGFIITLVMSATIFLTIIVYPNMRNIVLGVVLMSPLWIYFILLFRRRVSAGERNENS